MNRMYSVLNIKAVEEEQRIIRGVATTPNPDRVGDIVEPLGVQFKNPMPLLHQHDHSRPVGTVTFDRPTKDGITFEARLPKIEEPGPLRDRVETAWGEVKAGLVRAVSIGFRALEYSFLDEGGIRFNKSEVLELSLVSVPANADAVISTIKSIDAPLLAATGKEPKATDRPVRPGASGKTVKSVNLRPKEGTGMKTIAEQIAALEASRQAKSARMAEVMQKSIDEGRSTDQAEQEEFDTLDQEVEAIDGDLKRLRALEKAQAASAKPVAGQKSGDGTAVRQGLAPVQVKKELPKGTAFTRYAMALAAGRGSISDAIKYVEARQRWMDETPEVLSFIKADPGTTTDATWAAPLVNEQNLAGEFIELLRPATILGRIPGIRQVPFNVRIPVQTGGSTVNWVGEAAPKPVSELAFDAITLGMNKVAGIVVLTDELVRSSQPNAEDTVRRDLVEQVARFLDAQFVTPSVAAGTNNPASITNGVTPITASGTDAEALYYDLNRALAAFDNSDLGTGQISLIMSPGLARGISSLRNALGQFEFGGLNMAGGNLNGFGVITSNSAPAGTIILVKGDEILLADDGRVDLDASREATLDMNGGNTPNFNLWQRNAIGIRAERFITWRKRRADAVSMISTAAYGPAAPSAG